MPEFFNPYNFVPVEKTESAVDINREQIEDQQSDHVRHDRFNIEHADNGNASCYSGRILCRIALRDPLVIGNEQQESDDGYTEVKPFEIEKGVPSIPATSLKGLISSVAEAASNSALRVLNDDDYSYRARMDTSLSAIGMVKESENGGFSLLPLTLPTIQKREGRISLQAEYRSMFEQYNPPPLKVYIGDYQKSPKIVVGGLDSVTSYSEKNQVYFYARLNTPSWGDDFTLPVDDKNLHYSEERLGSHLLSQNAAEIITEENYRKKTNEEQKAYTRGILRILGNEGRDFPKGKKHELFIPYPEGSGNQPKYPIPEDIVQQFYTMADLRTKDKDEKGQLPYEPKGTLRNLDPENEKDKFRLKEGDLIYFRTDGYSITEISLSSMWRRWAGTTHQHFREKIDPEKLPFSGNRKKITIAEQLFGLVEQNKTDDKEEEKPASLALAGRLRFSFGTLWPILEKPYLAPIPLRVLGSPKPPQPYLYFKNAGRKDRPVTHEEILNHYSIPQGRKFYLHRQKSDVTPWISHNNDPKTYKLKNKVTPISTEAVFYFHIDFDNLSNMELGLLLYALKPNETFCHKLGMGKSLGLGTVDLQMQGVFLVDRLDRYSETDLFNNLRYQKIWLGVEVDPAGWPEKYAREKTEVVRTEILPENWTEMIREEFTGWMDQTVPGIRKALEGLGNPTGMKSYPVRTPYIDKDNEENTYEWFSSNNDIRKNIPQFLKPAALGSLQSLTDNWQSTKQN